MLLVGKRTRIRLDSEIGKKVAGIYEYSADELAFLLYMRIQKDCNKSDSLCVVCHRVAVQLMQVTIL